MQALRQFDLYQKADEVFRVRTLSGAFISIICLILSLILFYNEFLSYLRITRVDTLRVDQDNVAPLTIYLDITFPSMPCSEVHLDVEESTGSQQVDVHDHISKLPVFNKGQVSRQQAVIVVRRFEEILKKEKNKRTHEDEEPEIIERISKKIDALKEKYHFTEDDYKVGGLPENYCGSCYGAGEPGECCNTCEHVREAYKLKKWVLGNEGSIEQCIREARDAKTFDMKIEGCNIAGRIQVAKVSGNFHFAPGTSTVDEHGHSHGHHTHDFSIADLSKFNVSHTINKLSFGPAFPDMINPMDQYENILPGLTGSGLYRYFIKVVPTTYITFDGQVTVTNQYSFTQHFKPADYTSGSFTIPGIFFVYDLSPIAVTLRETSPSLSTFVTNVCSIVGGIVAVAGLFDAFVYRSSKKFKQAMGKDT